MADHDHKGPASAHYMPTMTGDYSRISDTAKAVDFKIMPVILDYIKSIAAQITRMDADTPFVIADYGAADGVNSSALFENIIGRIRAINPSLKIRLVFNDIALQDYFDRFWVGSRLKQIEGVEAQYIRRSFYRPFPEIKGKLNLGFSSTSLHWLNTEDVGTDFFKHPVHIQANQLPEKDRRKFVDKWKRDWRAFLTERAAELVTGGALFMANLTNRGGDRWPASAGYNNLRDACHELCSEGRIKPEEWTTIFVPDYFATPQEMKSLLQEDGMAGIFSLGFFEEMTVPCAYYSKFKNHLDDDLARAKLADTLAHVVRAWSESSIKTGLAVDDKPEIEEIYQRLRDKFYRNPRGLPYEYCLTELIKK